MVRYRRPAELLVGVTAQGNLTRASRGAIGVQGLTLNSATSGSAQVLS
ncbi:MAG TPA: hypothetical protein VKE93_06705 [Candidatus Angelobacter sp.]|nr:hypothetical protein [Candidatus Angelobacter sp.]